MRNSLVSQWLCYVSGAGISRAFGIRDLSHESPFVRQLDLQDK